MQKVVLLFGFLALITAVCPVFAGEKYLLEQQCNQCRADTNQCYDDLDSSSGGVAAATMSEACVNMQATCDRVCNSSMGTSPDRYNYGLRIGNSTASASPRRRQDETLAKATGLVKAQPRATRTSRRCRNALRQGLRGDCRRSGQAWDQGRRHPLWQKMAVTRRHAGQTRSVGPVGR
jgi:hypothetical protein